MANIFFNEEIIIKTSLDFQQVDELYYPYITVCSQVYYSERVIKGKLINPTLLQTIAFKSIHKIATA